MRIEEIECELPNGFHDSSLKSLEIDYELGEVRMFLDVLVGTPEDMKPEDRERKRKAKLTLYGVSYIILEPPANGNDFKRSGGIRIDAGAEEFNEHDDSIAAVDKGNSRYWFFLSQWNSFIRLSSSRASLEWI